MNSKVKKELMFILPKLRRYCYGLTGNKDQGDDLLHDSIVKILNKSHFILSTSTFEGYGLPILEGMCLGLVPISFYYGGIMEYYNGKNINLIP